MERASAVETELYDRDFALWVKAQVDALRAGRLSAVDVENVVEELEALAKRDRHAVQDRLSVLGAHLLKRRYQAENAGHAWGAKILKQSARIKRILTDSPSLRRDLPRFLVTAYVEAIAIARAETGLETLPPLPDDEFVEACCRAINERDSPVFYDIRREFAEMREHLERASYEQTD